ncbi:hypothetical protein [Sphingobacterium sp. HMA12]|uniref:hypothetical protein n=1 Tax=Sphingobacterium sp. HMA12 TaxID=2050894 RepID=UPI000CE9D1A9|nr:hypothetical protein [Sphingobacterium sp. HMA12]
MVTGILLILFIFLGAFFWRKKQLAQRFNENVEIAIDYMVQERPGQYSGDRNAKSGVFIFNAGHASDTLKNVVIKTVKPLHAALDVNLERILLISFERAATPKKVSVRFKVVKKRAKIDDLKGVQIRISGVLNFKQGSPKKFTAVLPIAGLYQDMAQPVDLHHTELLGDIANLNLSI